MNKQGYEAQRSAEEHGVNELQQHTQAHEAPRDKSVVYAQLGTELYCAECARLVSRLQH